jgi:hypothetical protein
MHHGQQGLAIQNLMKSGARPIRLYVFVEAQACEKANDQQFPEGLEVHVQPGMRSTC